MGQYKIFLSSSFHEFKEYRESIINLEQKFKDQFIFTNLYSELDISPIEQSLRDVSECDIFLLLVGNTYGYIPKDSIDQKSITQLESERAIAQNKPMLVFFYEDSYNLNQPEGTDELSGEYKKLKEFKNYLQDRFVIKYFLNESELLLGVIEALINLKQSLEKREKLTKKNNLDTKSNNKIEIPSLNIIRLLLSSPSDVYEERERVAKAIFKFNNEFVEEKGVFIKLIKWEDMAPQIDKSPQFTINNQIGTYDIFIGIMWNRFGTPTDVASSGTEEEFDTALKSYHSQKKPWISFYFSHRAKALISKEQLRQKNKVIEFQDKLEKLGIITVYKSLEKFEEIILEDIKKIIKTANLHKL